MFRRELLARGEVERFRMARTVLGRPVYVGSCYRAGDLLVDAGPPFGAPDLRAALPERPRAVLVTHGHEDHVGGVAALGAPAFGAPGLRLARNVPFYRRVAWGEPPPAHVAPVPAELEGRGARLVPLPTPGHTPDHLAYWEPDRGWLFAGDAALGHLRYSMRGEDLGAYMASLRAMRDRKPDVVFPAHGPVLDRPQEQLGAQLAHLDGLRERARALAEQGVTDRAIARQLLGRDGWLGWASRGEFTKAQLVRGLLEARP
ncbi:MAG TPA: MBL fold metallo-hydrolase [Candidatus Thermoplasmatota archaeon]|nr:MBL fold metallo-hydrolase [Candidatus Thermoplasmatota archaeon]